MVATAGPRVRARAAPPAGTGAMARPVALAWTLKQGRPAEQAEREWQALPAARRAATRRREPAVAWGRQVADRVARAARAAAAATSRSRSPARVRRARLFRS